MKFVQRRIADVLQVLGLLVAAAGVGVLSVAGGLIVLGVGAILMGVALERSGTNAR